VLLLLLLCCFVVVVALCGVISIRATVLGVFIIFAGIKQDEHVAEHVCSLEMVKEHYSGSICTGIEVVEHFLHRKLGRKC